MKTLIIIGLIIYGLICFAGGALVGSNNAKKTQELANKAKAEAEELKNKVSEKVG